MEGTIHIWERVRGMTESLSLLLAVEPFKYKVMNDDVAKIKSERKKLNYYTFH
jgi:hypothetical protein